jgi:hypothetical protein
MRYVYANFTDSSCNFGNRIIDFATRKLMLEYLPPPAYEFDSFSCGPARDIDVDFLIVPGCTMITKGQNPGLDSIGNLPYPSFCLAGSLWQDTPQSGWLIRNRVVGGRTDPADLSIVRQLAQPIGARDPYTYKTLRSTGIETVYVGCPTLHLPREDISDDGYILMSLGRARVREQWRMARRLGRYGNVIGICHEENDYRRLRAVGWDMPLVTFVGDVELYLSYFKRATAIVTGRLHGALPGVAYGKSIFYYGTRDTRTTLLDDLGVRVWRYRDIPGAIEKASRSVNRGAVDQFKSRWKDLLEGLAGRAQPQAPVSTSAAPPR